MAASRAERDKVAATGSHCPGQWRQHVTPVSSPSPMQAQTHFGPTAFPGESRELAQCGASPPAPLPAALRVSRGNPGLRGQDCAPGRAPPGHAALAGTSLDGDRSLRTASECPAGLHRAAVRAAAEP